MNIQEEKAYLYEMMKEITQERRRLTDMYYGLKERLDFLHKEEEKGIETLSLKGYVDLHNQTQKEIITRNIQREANHIINEVNKKNDNIIEEKEIIPKEEILREKEIVAKKENRTGKLNIDKVIGLVASTLKEQGTPMALDDLFERVNEKSDADITKTNFRNNIIRRAIKKNNRIENITRGFYQYR